MTAAAPTLRDLTGDPDRPGVATPPEVDAGLRRLGARWVAAAAAAGARPAVDVEALLTERARLTGLRRGGRVSCGGATRLLPTADGWVAVALARPEDVELLPAWLGRHVDPAPRCGIGPDAPWEVVGSAVAGRDAASVEAAGAELGLPVAALPAPDGAPIRPPVLHHDAPTRRPGRLAAGLRVVDLGSLWAGPLCGRLLAEAGALVTKVESTARPDGARAGSPEFFQALNGAKAHVSVDLASDAGRAALHDLVAGADVVIEASRPRALRQLGIDARTLLARPDGPTAWVSITGYGLDAAHGLRVAFGDDAAVAGGLVAHQDGAPVFLGDAVADPLTGLTAAAAVLEAVAEGRRCRLDVAMAAVAAGIGGFRH